MPRVLKGCAIGCVSLTVLLVIGVVFGARALTGFVNQKPPAPPVAAPNSVFRSRFVTNSGEELEAGTAFVIHDSQGKPTMLTALHLFGEAGGLSKEIPPAEMSKRIVRGALLDFRTGKPVGSLGAARLKTGKPFSEAHGARRDLAAFSLKPTAPTTALKLAVLNPRSMEWVWLLGDEVKHDPQTPRLFPGRVLLTDSDSVTILFEPSVELMAFSGAPLINGSGEVVGTLISGDESGRIGSANPVEEIRAHLRENKVIR